MESVKKIEPQELTVSEEGKNIAMISYLTIIGLIIAFIQNGEKKDPFAAYHIRQSIGLAIVGLGISVVGMVPILGWILSFVAFFLVVYMWVIGLMNAVNKRQKPLPFLGKKFEEWFESVG
ncbi:DUF4870 domain-containing protein [Moheibacter stercoris]|uniref:Membrane protein n=1 Tax=Moheibacter stercoris TaxID=1628251 RepID=A0ABV2LQM1_9FLAO